jgi:hypothetical protein
MRDEMKKIKKKHDNNFILPIAENVSENEIVSLYL